MRRTVKLTGKAMYVASAAHGQRLRDMQRAFYLRSWALPKDAATSVESPVRNESRTPGSEEGALQTADEILYGGRVPTLTKELS